MQEALEHERQTRGITDPAATIALRPRRHDGVLRQLLLLGERLRRLLLQALVASRLLRYGGFGAIFLMLPTCRADLVHLDGARCRCLWMVRVMKVAENSTDYSINNTARQVLWLPTTPR